MKVDVIKKYFQSWLDNDVEIVKQTFSENALYSGIIRDKYWNGQSNEYSSKTKR